MSQSKDPPENYVCPISLEIMRNPILVLHEGNTFNFDRRSLELHAQTKYKNRNPLTNLPGFQESTFIPNERLQEEIQASEWAYGDNAEPERGDLVNAIEYDTDDEEDAEFLTYYVRNLMERYLSARRRLFPAENEWEADAQEEEARVPESIVIRIMQPEGEVQNNYSNPVVFVRETRRSLYFAR